MIVRIYKGWYNCLIMDTQYFKEKLLGEKKLVEVELGEVGILNQDTNEWEAKPQNVDESAPDANDLGDRFEDFEEKTSQVGALSARLASIERALTNIDSDTYGTCRVCGAEIEAERLEANPAAETCVAHLNN